MAAQAIFTTNGRLVVELPPEFLERLGLRDGSLVSVELDEARQVLLIHGQQSDEPLVDPEFAERVARFIDRYRPALEALAKR